MATKVTILGEQPIEQEKKKIEFCKWVDVSGGCVSHLIGLKPHDFQNIELIRLKQTSLDYDVMFAYNKDRSVGIIYLGHFNDGIV